MKKHTTVVLGASSNPERYSNRAIKLLLEHGSEVIPINPSGGIIEDMDVCQSLADINESIDTLTLYIGAKRSSALIDDIIKLNPKRIIFNPGTENSELESACDKNNIKYFHACTLVLLKTDQFFT